LIVFPGASALPSSLWKPEIIILDSDTALDELNKYKK
jgi:hypothetical protein